MFIYITKGFLVFFFIRNKYGTVKTHVQNLARDTKDSRSKRAALVGSMNSLIE